LGKKLKYNDAYGENLKILYIVIYTHNSGGMQNSCNLLFCGTVTTVFEVGQFNSVIL